VGSGHGVSLGGVERLAPRLLHGRSAARLAWEAQKNFPDLPLMRLMALPHEDLVPCLPLAWLQTRDNMLHKILFHHLS